LGGLGIGEKIYWDETVPETKAFDPENPLIMMTQAQMTTWEIRPLKAGFYQLLLAEK
jgi:hypothetical protein